MFKWFKKHSKKLIIASSILTACVCCLFGFTNSYAYDYNNNQLVGNNLVDNCNVNYCFVSGDSFNLNSPQTPSENLIVSHENNANFIDIEFTNTNVVNGVGYLCIYMPMSQLYANHNANSYYNIGLLIESENFTKTTYYLSGMNTFLVSTNSYGNSFNFISNTSSFNLNYLVGSNSFICNFAITNTNFYSSSDSNLCFLINIRNSNQQNDFNLGHLKFKAYIFEGNYNINYAYSNTSIFVPYSSIDELQEAYNTLQQQYNDYVASHSYTNTQYNDLVSANSSLQQQISNLQLQYDTYVASHSHTNDEYNELYERLGNLQENYSDLHDELLELQNEYDDLQNRYDTLLSEYNKIYYNQNHGFWNYINNVEFYSGEYTSGLKTLDDLLNDEIITYQNFDLALGFREYVESVPSYVYVDVDFIDNVVPLSVFNIKVVDIITPYTFSFTLHSVPSDETVVVSVFTQDVPNNYISGYEIMKAYFGNDYTIDEYNDAVEKNPYVYIQDFLLDSTYSTSGEVYDPTLESGVGIDGESYQFGYNQGYATAYSNYVDTYASNTQLETKNAQLSFQVNQLQHDISVSSSAYQSLLNSYNNLVEGRSDLPTLFFTIAQTPFETFKTIWNVDFLGINLAGFFTGIIMLGLMIWVIKKIF